MRSPNRGFFIMLATAIAAGALFWLLDDHWQHAKGFVAFLPFLVFLACPLMHLFMHHGHGESEHPHGNASPGPRI